MMPGGSEIGCPKINTLKLLNNKELRLSMGQQGKRRVIEEFSTEKMIGKYFELYQSLIKS